MNKHCSLHDDINDGKYTDFVTILKRLKDNFDKYFEKEFKDFKLTGPQGMIIFLVSKNGPMKISDISKNLGLSNSTVSGIVDRLETSKRVLRRRDENDRRVVRVEIDPDFKKEAEKRHLLVKDHLFSLLNLASPEELEAVNKGFEILNQLIDRAEKYEKE